MAALRAPQRFPNLKLFGCPKNLETRPPKRVICFLVPEFPAPGEIPSHPPQNSRRFPRIPENDSTSATQISKFELFGGRENLETRPPKRAICFPVTEFPAPGKFPSRPPKESRRDDLRYLRGFYPRATSATLPTPPPATSAGPQVH